jgi:nucleotide-binding universal stress UspA family protein
MEIRNILCAVDFTERCPEVVEQATDLARSLGASLHVVYVMQSLDMYEQFNVSMSFREEYQNSIAVQAQKNLDQLIDKISQTYDQVKGYLLRGDVAQQILQFGKEQQVDLIVIGTHGSKKITEIIFGSVAEKVVKQSNIPVLTLKPLDCRYEPV